MIFKIKQMPRIFLPVLALVITSCNMTPFGGIAVPGMTAVMPKEAQDAEAIQEELKALHLVNATPYTIHPGDTFQVSVYNQPSLSATVLIAPDGTTSLPIIGIVKLANLNM